MRFFFSKHKTVATQSLGPVHDESRYYGYVHAVSETGPVRHHNEDSIVFTFLTRDQRELLAVLSDGMGGHNAGEIASKMACDSIMEYVLQDQGNTPILRLLEQAFCQTHRKILEKGNKDAAYQGMGTTATAVLVKDAQLYWAHVGDSRLYQFRHNLLEQLTKDHTLVNQMYENGEINREERDAHPMKNVLLQAMGTTTVIEPQISKSPICPEVRDKYLLCSDGVYDVFSHAELTDLMRMQQPAFALECLRSIAIERNASDNFSAILISFSQDPPSAIPATREQNILL